MSAVGEGAASKVKQVPIEEGLWVEGSSSGQKPHLRGVKCEECGTVMFPSQARCINCSGSKLVDIVLSNKGRVFNCTVVRQSPPFYIGTVPYCFGHVELPEGVLIPTLYTGCGFDKALEIGTEVEMVIEKLSNDEENNEVLVYKFRPV